MKNKKFIYNIVFSIAVAVILFGMCGKVFAETALSSAESLSRKDRASIWLHRANNSEFGWADCTMNKETSDYGGQRCFWNQGVLKIGGRKAYCADISKEFKPNRTMTKMDAVAYLKMDLKNRGRNVSESKIKETVTKMALYDKYIKSRNDLTAIQKIYFVQVLMGGALQELYVWFNDPNVGFWIETYKPNILFPNKCKNGCTTSQENANEKFEKDIYNNANNYYQNNKNKYTTKGYIWYEKSKYNQTSNGHYLDTQPLMEFDDPKLKTSYDYSVDAACVGCDVKGLENRAMIIQDTTDWEAIMNSKNQTLIPNASKNYYYGPDSGSYCREEYRVKLPDSSKEITVKPGKYLTVGALKKELEKLTKGTANVGPIEVTKIIQCRGGDLNKRRTLNEQRYFINRNGKKAKSLGTITLQYEECGDNRKYNGKIELVPNFKEGVPVVNSSNSNGTLTQSQTVSYTLPEGKYRYVRNQDGLSMKDINSIKKSELNTKYRDLGISTLPISFDNEGDKVKVKANLHFAYTLPTHSEGAYSYIKDAYNDKNYFKPSSGNAAENVYKKYTKGDAKAKSLINESACNKLYGTTNQACINSHVNDKTADCKTINKIFSDKTGSCEKAYSQKGYVCPVKIPPIPPCPPGECDDPGDTPCPDDRPRCADGTCPVDGKTCTPCDDDLCTDIPGTIDVIYRPIDLANPFPGQKGSKTKSRKTGANWCEYNQKTGKINCSANNAVSKKYIINKKVYNDNHVLYKVTLDTNTINKVRNYNKNKKYDDFNLKCKDGKACISDFLNKVIKVEGKCSDVNYGNFYACNK